MHRFEHHWMSGHHWGGGFFGGPGMVFSVLGILFWVVLMIGLAWAILSLLLPLIRPMLAEIFGSKQADVSALEILRRRYAAGEIDADKFEQMHERLLASYQQEGHGMPREASYQEEDWIRYRDV